MAEALYSFLRPETKSVLKPDGGETPEDGEKEQLGPTSRRPTDA